MDQAGAGVVALSVTPTMHKCIAHRHRPSRGRSPGRQLHQTNKGRIIDCTGADRGHCPLLSQKRARIKSRAKRFFSAPHVVGKALQRVSVAVPARSIQSQVSRRCRILSPKCIDTDALSLNWEDEYWRG
jgi:hypothetical protein